MASSQTSIPPFVFTLDESDPLRVTRMELEFVSFSLKVTTQNGETFVMANPDSVQELLNKAHDFNLAHFQGSKQSQIDVGNSNDDFHGRVTTEIKLDPLNSVNTFHIPV